MFLLSSLAPEAFDLILNRSDREFTVRNLNLKKKYKPPFDPGPKGDPGQPAGAGGKDAQQALETDPGGGEVPGV